MVIRYYYHELKYLDLALVRREIRDLVWAEDFLTRYLGTLSIEAHQDYWNKVLSDVKADIARRA